jgi:hypothetical protein
VGERLDPVVRSPRRRGAGSARRPGALTEILAALAGALAAAGVAAAWIPFRSSHGNVEVALALVVVVAAAGTTRCRAAVLTTAAVAAATFTFFDTEPYEHFAFARQPDIATAVSLVVVGLITGELALRLARQRRVEQGAVGDLGRVRQAAALVAGGEELVVLIGAVARELTVAAGLSDCSFTTEPIDPDVAKVGRDGRLHPAAGDAATEAVLPVWALAQVVGHFVLRRPHIGRLGVAQLHLAMTLADQVGAALAVQAPPPAVERETGEGAVPRLRVVRQPH